MVIDSLRACGPEATSPLNLEVPQGLSSSKDGPNHDARFQYCLLFSFVLLVLVMCVFGSTLGNAQVGLVGGGIGTLAGLLKQTQYLPKRSNDDK